MPLCQGDLISLAFLTNGAVDGRITGRPDMIKFKPTDENAERFAEIEKQITKLDREMASPNIKETKHAELSVLHRQLNAERESLRQPRA
jgi:hypothetical protein